MKTKKQRFKPFSREEKEQLETSIAEMEITRDEAAMKAAQFSKGLINIDDEIEANIHLAKMKLKAAEIELESLEYDKEHEIHKRKMIKRLHDAREEVKRHTLNIESLKKQLKQGKPILEDEKMSEEPTIEKTPEEIASEEKEKKDDQEKPDESAKEEGDNSPSDS